MRIQQIDFQLLFITDIDIFKLDALFHLLTVHANLLKIQQLIDIPNFGDPFGKVFIEAGTLRCLSAFLSAASDMIYITVIFQPLHNFIPDSRRRVLSELTGIHPEHQSDIGGRMDHQLVYHLKCTPAGPLKPIHHHNHRVKFGKLLQHIANCLRHPPSLIRNFIQ